MRQRRPTALTIRWLLHGGAVATGVMAAGGCVGLSLGGKTTYVEDADSAGRLSALEARVTSLEHAMWGTPPEQASEVLTPLPDGSLPDTIGGP